MKKIRIIIGTLEVGGTETHLLKVLPKLVELGWRIEVIVLSNPGTLREAFVKAGIIVKPIFSAAELNRLQKWPLFFSRPCRLLIALNRLRLEYKKDPDTPVHCFLPEAYLVGIFSAWIFGFKGVQLMSRRSLNHYQKRRWGFAWIERLLHPRMQVILGNSRAVIDQLIEEGVKAQKLRLIYNGLDLTEFVPKRSKIETRQLLGISEACFVMVMTANLIFYKGHRDLLLALNKIKNHLPNPWKLLCLGRDSGIQFELEKKAKEYGVSENILWLGSRSDVPEVLASSDLAILASHEEGFPNALLEYMALGLPIVATSAGGSSEAVLHEECGLIVPPKNPEALGKAILELSQNTEKALCFGERAKIRVQQEFSLKGCVERYAHLYHSLMNGQIPVAQMDFTFFPEKEAI